ncbi:uncharacterized protein LOC110422909 [Herrania umbratica]|uniref:Uncharacterized protein LOC110422909 n=1 Tax=Herrania umbratica TaxID=108875 RepID=A0A6J1AZP1_9ROSI|nr:uncharacterized protein LOC110422909 [Herrania umbratica]
MGIKASSNELSNGLPEKFTQKTESIPTTVLQVVMNRQDDNGKSCINSPSNEMEGDNLVRTKREEAPAHYILEIESFQRLLEILSKPRLDRYESTEFAVSGHKWRLILYPNGDKQRNGGDYISLYLRIVDIGKLGPAWEIDAFIYFFVLDQENNQYISIQDGRVKRFNAVKKEWGFSRLLPLTEFLDTSKGYLSEEDSCKFGVEVFVLENKGKGECFSTLDNPIRNYYNWKVEKFSKLGESSHYSEGFSVGDYKWKLHLYPQGVAKVKGQYLSIFLCLHEPTEYTILTQLHVEFKLRIIDQSDKLNSKKTEKTGNAWFSATKPAWGFPYFIKLADLKRTRDFIVNDDMVVEAEISSMSMAQELTPDPPQPRKRDDKRR